MTEKERNSTPYRVDGSATTNSHDAAPPATDERQHGYIYRITNRKNGAVYVGEHRLFGTPEPWRSYMGSGTYLKAEVEAYGVENFSKEFVAWTHNEAHAKLLEARFISEALTGSHYVMNSNNAYSLRRDPVANAMNFAYKASWRSKSRLAEIITELKAMGAACGDDLRERLALRELEDAHRLALNIKRHRFAETGVEDAKDRISSAAESW